MPHSIDHTTRIEATGNKPKMMPSASRKAIERITARTSGDDQHEPDLPKV
jgi:hypothetical protein